MHACFYSDFFMRTYSIAHACMNVLIMLLTVLFVIAGQFWNIDVSAEKYTVTEEDRISPSDTHFAITVRPPSGSVRRFFADIHPETWDLENRHCLYAGSGQGGRTYEVPSLPDTVIEGRYSYYKTDDSDLFQCGYRYSRFESVCPSVPN